MKISIIKSLKLVAVFMVFLLLFSISKPTWAQNDDSRGAKVSPGYFIYNVKSGTVINDKIELSYINLKNTDLTFSFLEFDKSYQKPTDSNLLKSILTVKEKKEITTEIIETKLDTQSLIDKTYFFGLTINLNTKDGSGMVQPKIAINIPIILTVNSSDTNSSPKPNIKIDSKTNIFFNEQDLKLNFQIENPSTKLIEIGGEIIFTNDKNEELYSQKISIPENRLLPNTYFQEEIKDFKLNNDSNFPYIGKVKVFYRGTIDSKRHIESQVIEVYIIPWQYIVGIIFIVLILGFIPFYFIKKKKTTS